MLTLLILLLGTLAGFAAGAVYGANRSLYVGEKAYEALELWEKLKDRFSKLPRSTRKKLARAKRIGQEISEKYR